MISGVERFFCFFKENLWNCSCWYESAIKSTWTLGFKWSFCVCIFISLIVIAQSAKLALFRFLQSSLAAARADNFYYPPEWTPNQVNLEHTISASLLYIMMRWYIDSYDAIVFRVLWTSFMVNMLWGRGHENWIKESWL